MLPFKKGAFIAGGPIKLCALKYAGKFHPSYLMMKPLPNLLGMLTNLTMSCTLIEGDAPIYKKEGVSWEIYAEQVRGLMCDQMDFKELDGDYFHKK